MYEIPSAPKDVELKYVTKTMVWINGVAVYTFYVSCIDYDAIPLEANVRLPSASTPYKNMCETLRYEPDNFFFKNGGINVIADDLAINESKSTVTLMISKGYGILNGGHTQQAILDTREEIDINESAVVRVEVIKRRMNNNEIAELAAAKNSASNVKSSSIANKKGYFELLKKELKPVYETKIVWYENEITDGKPMEAKDLIAMINMFDINRFTNTNAATTQPIASANANGSVFTQWYNANENDDSKFSYLYPIVNDILDLYEYILSTFNSNIGKGFTQRNTIIKKVKKGSAASKTIFTGMPVEYTLPKQILMPILGSFRANLKMDADGPKWVIPPRELFDSVKKGLIECIHEYLRKNDINKLSKDQNIWFTLYNIVRLEVVTHDQS